jgi:hypothetical protein
VRPEGLDQFKNPPHRDSNPRPSGLQHSALNTTLPSAPIYKYIYHVRNNLFVQSEVKLSLRLTNSALRYEGVWGSGCVNPHFHDLDTIWKLSHWLHALGKNPRYPSDGICLGPRIGLDNAEKRKILTVPGLELRHHCRAACSHSLYQLSYRVSSYY